MRDNAGAWIGWHGAADDDVRAVRARRASPLVPGAAVGATRSRTTTRASPTRTLWPLYHDVDRAAGVPPGVVGRLRRGQPALRRPAPPRSPPTARWSGCRTTSCSSCPQMLREQRPDLRIGFFLHIPFPPTSCSASSPGAASCSRACSAPTWSASSCPGGAPTSSGWSGCRLGHKTHRDTVYLPDGREVRARAFPISIDVDGARGAARRPDDRAAGRRDPPGARQPRSWCCSASTGSTTPRASAAAAAFGELLADGSLDLRRRGVRPGGDAVAGSGSSSTACCATTSTGWSAASTATSAASAAQPITTCTRPTRARRWRRCTAPPTSWW